MRIVIGMIVWVTVVFAGRADFTKMADMCDTACPNKPQEVVRLQYALNRDDALGVRIKEDGIWGKETKAAVVAFQRRYGLEHDDGWVGVRTKQALQKQYGNIDFPKLHVAASASHAHEGTYATYEEFRRRVNLRRSFAVYKDPALLKKANGRNVSLLVDVSEQRIRMYVDGKVALDSPCTTGSRHKLEPNTRTYRDKHTPLGTFRIMEKIRDKRSTIFGKFYKNGRCIYKGDRRKYCGPKKGVCYVGASLEYWMRLTSSGIGLHASKYVKRYPATNGCIRLPKHVAKLIFSKVRVGTRVKVVS